MYYYLSTSANVDTEVTIGTVGTVGIIGTVSTVGTGTQHF